MTKFFGLSHRILYLDNPLGITVSNGFSLKPYKVSMHSGSLREETKKQEHTLRNDPFSVFLVYSLPWVWYLIVSIAGLCLLLYIDQSDEVTLILNVDDCMNEPVLVTDLNCSVIVSSSDELSEESVFEETKSSFF